MSKYIEYKNKRFLPVLPRYEPIVQDHTAMSVLNECDRKYFYRVVLGKVPQQSNNQVLLDGGTMYHKFRETLELEWKKDQNRQRAFGEALKHVFSMNLDIPPKDSKWEYVDRTFMAQVCGFAFQRWCKEKDQGSIEVIATEQPFNVMLPNGIFIGGRADEIIRWSGGIYGRDFKFSSKDENMWKRLISPNEQATRYIIGESHITGTKVDGVIFEVVHHQKGIKKEDYKPRFEIQPHLAQRTEFEVEMWNLDYQHINRQMALNREYDIWPMREFKTNCAWCDFALVCRKTSEADMIAVLQQNYKTQPWDFEHTEQEEIL